MSINYAKDDRIKYIELNKEVMYGQEDQATFRY